MAVPKKRTGHSAQGHRRSNWKATKPEVTKCSNCGEIALTHTVCTACGYYKGKAVSIKSQDYVETTIETKKTAKKTSTKTKKAETKEKETVENAETTEVMEKPEVKEAKSEKVEVKKVKETKPKKTSKSKKAEENN